MTDNSLEGVYIFAERVRQLVVSSRFSGLGDQNVTVSIGVAKFLPDDFCMESVIKRADDALYEAKNEGKNRVK